MLRLALLIKEKLMAFEVEVMLTRDTDRVVSMRERVDLANKEKVDLFYSIHSNAFGNQEAQGYEDYTYLNAKDQTTRLRQAIHPKVMDFLKKADISDRGLKQANFYVLRETTMPAILTENLFVTNPHEASLLKDEKFLQGLAAAHVQGLVSALDLSPKQQQQPPKQQQQPSGQQLYRVQVGSFASRENAQDLVKELAAKGYASIIVATGADGPDTTALERKINSLEQQLVASKQILQAKVADGVNRIEEGVAILKKLPPG